MVLRASPSEWPPTSLLNLGEVCDAIAHLIEQPLATSEDLMHYVKGPDFPTGAIILGSEGIRSAYTTGRGRIVMRAQAEEVTSKAGKRQIVITEIPFQVNKAALVERIAVLAREKRITGISEVRDESDREGLRVVMGSPGWPCHEQPVSEHGDADDLLREHGRSRERQAEDDRSS